MDYYLTKRRLSFDLAKENGWYPSTEAGDNHIRIVIPATSRIPGNHYWQARAIDKGVEPRYQSPHASRGDAIVVVWPHLFNRRSFGAVVEGPMDALAVAEAGCVGIALMGVMPPESALALTATMLSGYNAFLIFDRDQPGPAATRTLPFLAARGVKIRLVDPYPAKDLAELKLEARKELLQ
jgi:Toprim domain-containing protein